jgi:hypothetical protein
MHSNDTSCIKNKDACRQKLLDLHGHKSLTEHLSPIKASHSHIALPTSSQSAWCAVYFPNDFWLMQEQRLVHVKINQSTKSTTLTSAGLGAL